MAQYAYPAFFAQEEKGGCSINSPNLKGCYTCGETIEKGLKMAAETAAGAVRASAFEHTKSYQR